VVGPGDSAGSVVVVGVKSYNVLVIVFMFHTVANTSSWIFRTCFASMTPTIYSGLIAQASFHLLTNSVYQRLISSPSLTPEAYNVLVIVFMFHTVANTSSWIFRTCFASMTLSSGPQGVPRLEDQSLTKRNPQKIVVGSFHLRQRRSQKY
jgi:hypothetical protein